MFQQPIANRFHIYLLLLVVLIETSFLELDILHINIEILLSGKDELGVVHLEPMTLEVGFLGKQ
jgi:hypothetical protein